MANPKHVAVVREGSEAIAKWRESQRRERLELSGADLLGAYVRGADLSGADLRTADLRMTDLGQTNLMAADLGGADLGMATLFKANLSGANLSEASLAQSDLSRANLSKVNLRRADLAEAVARQAVLSGADLGEASLVRADLSAASLDGANLTRARLYFSDLTDADLMGANLSEAALFGANLFGASLRAVNLTQARLGYTSLNDVDLSDAVGLTSVNHEFPSSVGVDTLVRSVRGAGGRLTPELTVFFRGAGVPQELLDALPQVVAEVSYYSCLIYYGQPDAEFAARFCEDLKSRGVCCWLYEMDRTAEEGTWGEIGMRRREAERMVVLCSVEALARDGVLKEIEEQIEEDADKLVPVSLDDLWREAGFKVMRGANDLKPFLEERNYADFANKPYREALEDLLKGLRREAWLRTEARAS